MAKCLLVELDGAARLAQGRVGIAQVAQRAAFPMPVADLASDGKCLLVELDGAARLAQIRVGIAQVAQRAAFPLPVADLAENCQALFVNSMARRTSPKSA